MTRTKINELTKLCLGPFDYYYHCNEVEELINHIASKSTIQWHKPEDKLPQDKDQVLWILTFPNAHIIYSGEFQKILHFVVLDNFQGDKRRLVHNIGDVRCWTYSKSILDYSRIKKDK